MPVINKGKAMQCDAYQHVAPKPVTKYVTLTVNVADKLEPLLLVSMSLRFPPRTGDQLRLLLIVISWLPPRK